MNIEDVKKLDDKALESKLAELYRERIEMQLKRATGTLKKTSDWSTLRKTIARILTVQTERKESQNV